MNQPSYRLDRLGSMSRENLEVYCEALEKALRQVIYDCDEMSVDWDDIAKYNGMKDVLDECIKEKGHSIETVVMYYLKTAYVFEGSSK